MKIIGVIPARYGSSRLPGKPLKDICGKPMIWWVYQQTSKVKRLDEVYVATDDNRIVDKCNELQIPVILTNNNHPTHLHRIHEVANKIVADYYVVVCGDEPLIDSKVIEKVIPLSYKDDFVVRALKREFKEPTEVLDPGNIKIVTNDNGDCLYLSRSPIPFPYKTILYKYYKIVGIECYNKKSLDFFVSKEAGQLEKIEDIAILRFIENGIKMHFDLVETDALSVDTEKDLEKVRLIIENRKSGGFNV